MTLITKYHLPNTLQRFRRALPVYFCVLMTRRTRHRALGGRSAADLPFGHECERHFGSLDGSSVLSCGRGSGQGQVVKQESIREHSTISYLARSPLTPCGYQFWVSPRARNDSFEFTLDLEGLQDLVWGCDGSPRFCLVNPFVLTMSYLQYLFFQCYFCSSVPFFH